MRSGKTALGSTGWWLPANIGKIFLAMWVAIDWVSQVSLTKECLHSADCGRKFTAVWEEIHSSIVATVWTRTYWQAKHNVSVTFFVPTSQKRFWIKKRAPFRGFVFFNHVLDKVIGADLSALSEMPICHPKMISRRTLGWQWHFSHTVSSLRNANLASKDDF